MHIDAQRLDGHRIEARAPCRHDAAATQVDALRDRGLIRPVKPYLIGEIGLDAADKDKVLGGTAKTLLKL